jgi:hypothetical protein
MDHSSLFGFLDAVEKHINPKTLNLYPKSEIPSFKVEIKSKNDQILNFTSLRIFLILAISIIKKAL